MESYIGYIKTPQDAIFIFEACRRGKLSRVARRLTSKERMDIRSGSIFCFDEREAGMRRWTDGRTWSPSRVLGSFLTYRELDTKRRPRRPSSNKQCIALSYKQNGLIKQSFSICTVTNQKLHLVSYYNKADVLLGRLTRPTQDVHLEMEIPKGLYPELNPLDISGGHSASIHAISRHNSIDSTSTTSSSLDSPPPHQQVPHLLSSSSISSSPQSSEDYYEEDLPTSYTNNTQTSSSIWNPTSLPPAMIIQDIAWEKLPCSEDNRQLNALQVRI